MKLVLITARILFISEESSTGLGCGSDQSEKKS